MYKYLAYKMFGKVFIFALKQPNSLKHYKTDFNRSLYFDYNFVMKCKITQ